MFCQQCGAQIPDNAAFCPNCGARMAQQTVGMQGQGMPDMGQQIQPQAYAGQQAQTPPGKKKSKKVPIIIAAVVAFAAVVLVVALNWNGQVNYVESVQQWTPFAQSQGLPYTMEEVLNRYLLSPEWEESGEKDVHSVSVSGKMNGKEGELSFTFQVREDPDNPDLASFKIVAAAVDDITTSDEGEAGDFLFYLFCAYDEGYEDLSWLDGDDVGAVNASGDAAEDEIPYGMEDVYDEFCMEARRTILSWFDRHPLMQDIRLQYVEEGPLGESAGNTLLYLIYREGEEYALLRYEPIYGDMTMESVMGDSGRWDSLQIALDEWYLAYYWDWTEDSGCYSELYEDGLYELYDGNDDLILEYYTEDDRYVICNNDYMASVELYGRNEDALNTPDYRSVYADKVRELVAENDRLLFSLIDVTGSGVPELLVDDPGYDISLYTWLNGVVSPVMEGWGYGTGGMADYSYYPGKNIISFSEMEMAGAIVYEYYMTINDFGELVDVYDGELKILNFYDANGNGIWDEGEEYDGNAYYYYDGDEISREEYESYRIPGTPYGMEGMYDAESIISVDLDWGYQW